MKKSVRMVTVLVLVGFLSGASLAAVYKYASPLIESNQKKELGEAILNIIPGASEYKSVTAGKEDIFEVYNKSGRLLGYAFIAEGNGYQGSIRIMAGIKKNLSGLYGIEVLESVETPGLGGEITGTGFKEQFKGLRVSPDIECVKEEKKNNNEIQAITGATISSKSVVNILNNKIARIKKALKK